MLKSLKNIEFKAPHQDPSMYDLQNIKQNSFIVFIHYSEYSLQQGVHCNFTVLKFFTITERERRQHIL